MNKLANPTYKPWLPGYLRWVGWISLVCLNLLGLAYLHWAKQMRTDPQYRSRWLIPYHVLVMICSSAFCLAYLVELFPREAFRISFFWWSVRDPPALIVVPLTFLIIGLAAIPLAGQRARNPK